MSLTNISRDSFVIGSMLSSSALAWSTSSGSMNSDAVVHSVHNSAKTTAASTVASNIGVLMKPPTEELVPYRVKAYINQDDVRIILGYVTAITGTNDSINDQNYFYFNRKFDEIIMVPYESSRDGQALGFALTSVAAGARGFISVQNLSVSPPPFSMGVS